MAKERHLRSGFRSTFAGSGRRYFVFSLVGEFEGRRDVVGHVVYLIHEVAEPLVAIGEPRPLDRRPRFTCRCVPSRRVWWSRPGNHRHLQR